MLTAVNNSVNGPNALGSVKSNISGELLISNGTFSGNSASYGGAQKSDTTSPLARHSDDREIESTRPSNRWGGSTEA